MITIDDFPFMLISMVILFISLVPCGFIYAKYFDRKPVLTIILCGVIFIAALYLIYFLRQFGADMGWFPPFNNSDANLTVTFGG